MVLLSVADVSAAPALYVIRVDKMSLSKTISIHTSRFPHISCCVPNQRTDNVQQKFDHDYSSQPIVLKSGSLSLLEPSGPVKGCNGIALLYNDKSNNNLERFSKCFSLWSP
jgi:hypothetical protein